MESDSEQFRAGALMPNIFGTFESTQLIAILSHSGSCRITDLSKAFKTYREAMQRRINAYSSESSTEANRCFSRRRIVSTIWASVEPVTSRSSELEEVFASESWDY